MKTIDQMVEAILAHEGGFAHHPNDRGGPTNFGITQATYSRWLGRQASLAEVQNMREETAKEIYLTNYYFAPRINGFDADVQPQVFDCAVNHGPRQAIKFVQTVVNLAGFGVIAVDGVNGPKTTSAAHRAYEAMQAYFINAIADERIHFYKQMVSHDPSQRVFLAGWLRRARAFKVEIGAAA